MTPIQLGQVLAVMADYAARRAETVHRSAASRRADGRGSSDYDLLFSFSLILGAGSAKCHEIAQLEADRAESTLAELIAESERRLRSEP